MNPQKNCLLAILILLPILANAEQVLRFGNFSPESKKRPAHAIIKEAYKRLNIHAEMVFAPAERSLWLVNNGIFDAEFLRVAGLEKIYPNLVMVKVPIQVVSLYVYTKNINFTVNGWQSLKPYRIAYMRGAKSVENNLQGFSIEAVTTIEQAFMMLEQNRIDIVIADDGQADEILPHYADIKVLTPPVYSFPMYHYVNKKHADLVPKLEAVLQQMNADNSIEKIKRELNEQHTAP